MMPKRILVSLSVKEAVRLVKDDDVGVGRNGLGDFHHLHLRGAHAADDVGGLDGMQAHFVEDLLRIPLDGAVLDHAQAVLLQAADEHVLGNADVCTEVEL